MSAKQANMWITQNEKMYKKIALNFFTLICPPLNKPAKILRPPARATPSDALPPPARAR